MSEANDTLAGRRCLVIGGGGEGNGRGITRSLAAAGAAVAVVDVDEQRAKEAAAELTSNGTTALGIAADVTEGDEIERLVQETVDGLGGIDVLVTVVGGHGMFAPWIRLHETTDEDWDRVVELNLRYVFRTVRSVLRVFLEQGTGGSIVSVGSIAGVVSSPMSSAYGAAKAGLINLARSVSLEYGRDGVRMNTLSCGLIMTPASRKSVPDPSVFVQQIPVGDAGSPEDVGAAAAFLASPTTSYISGQNLNIDGGVSVHFPLPLPHTEPHMAG